MPYKVEFSDSFKAKYSNSFTKIELDLIDDFIDHYELHGLTGWKGKVSPSDKVPCNDLERVKKIRHAQRYRLWHAHIGLPTFTPSQYGQYLVSDGVLHFQKLSPYKIKLLDIGGHNPMQIFRISLE
ncbi:hypothetical protein [Serratia quinivorans]|uniref:hypothetical protein n=1 Tax=Serratia quinivorans TaxID=137545 RepID=UPI0021BDEFAD|nr:hypothetical protein [Serratia quinivorans]